MKFNLGQGRDQVYNIATIVFVVLSVLFACYFFSTAFLG